MNLQLSSCLSAVVLNVKPLQSGVVAHSPTHSSLDLKIMHKFMWIAFKRPVVNIATNQDDVFELVISHNLLASHLSRHVMWCICDNQQTFVTSAVKRKQCVWYTGSMCEHCRFIASHVSSLSFNFFFKNVCTVETICFCAHSSVIWVFISLVVSQRRK